MIKFDHFSRFQKDFRQKMQGLHKIDHNSRKKLKTQGWKTQNSSKKLKVSAKSKTRFAENRSKKKAVLMVLPICFWSHAFKYVLEGDLIFYHFDSHYFLAFLWPEQATLGRKMLSSVRKWSGMALEKNMCCEEPPAKIISFSRAIPDHFLTELSLFLFRVACSGHKKVKE